MIITCNKCSTRFTLDDSLVAENGSKVRCSVCKNIFTAYPLPREPELPSAPVADFDSAPDLDDIPDFEMEDTEFSFDENEFDLNGGDGEKEPDQDQFEFEADEISEDIAIEADEQQDTDFDGIEFESLKDTSVILQTIKQTKQEDTSEIIEQLTHKILQNQASLSEYTDQLNKLEFEVEKQASLLLEMKSDSKEFDENIK